MDRILKKIREKLPYLSNRQKKVAQYILTNYEDAAFMTVAKLAEASEVSESTVVRFSSCIGYPHYSDMQDALRALIRGQLTQMDRLRRTGDMKECSSIMQTVIRSMRTDIRSIETTLLQIREEDLKQVIRSISMARSVYVVGTHSEYGIACYFASTLGWIRDNVYLIDATHSPTFDAMADINAKDVYIGMSFPPYPAATVRYLEAARSRGARTIAITDVPSSPLARRAALSLYAHDEKLFFADNSAPTVSLLSVILALVGDQNYEASYAKIARMNRYWSDIGFYFQEGTEQAT